MGAGMEDAITLSSGSDKDESDVEIVDAYAGGMDDAKPFIGREWTVAAYNVTPLFIDLTDPILSLPGPRRRKRRNSSAATEVVDLIDGTITNRTDQLIKSSPPDESETVTGKAYKILPSDRGGTNSLENSPRDSAIVSPMQDSDILKPKQDVFLNSVTEVPMTNKINYSFPLCVRAPIVKLTRLPLQEAHVRELKKFRSSVYLTKESKQLQDISLASDCINSRTTTISNKPQLNPLVDVYLQLTKPPWEQGQVEDRKEQGSTLSSIHDTRSHQLHLSTAPEKAQGSCQEDLCYPNSSLAAIDSGTKRLEMNPPESTQSPLPKPSSPDFHNPRPDLPIPQNLHLHSQPQAGSTSPCHNIESQANSILTSTDILTNKSPLTQTEEAEADLAMNSPAYLCNSIPSDPPLSVPRTEDLDEGTGTYRGDLGVDSPVHIDWQEGSDGEEVNGESKFGVHFRSASREDRRFVCPITLRKIMAGPVPDLGGDDDDEEEDGFGAPEELCRQSLSLVYSTIDENYPEGTLQLLSDLLQPGFYPPRDITSHLLRGILLDPQSPQYLCVQAFNLLIRTQRDVIKWLFAAIMKSTEHRDSKETAKERDEHMRMVSVFQRMLSMALEVDRSPALSSAKLSQELFHMLISSVPLRAHRMLLLESLQSKLLRCKLLEHLLDYACPQKIRLPMSLSLLLHFLKNCILRSDPMDGAQRWQKWEELVQLLWMLLLSYNKVMKGHLRSSLTERTGRVRPMIQTTHDTVSKQAVQEAVVSFLSRSQADLGQALPLHVEESLTYLQDHLLDVCQC
ncbi:uncharacterized protein simc1 isoform 2-T2 [Polymixia lowei]